MNLGKIITGLFRDKQTPNVEADTSGNHICSLYELFEKSRLEERGEKRVEEDTSGKELLEFDERIRRIEENVRKRGERFLLDKEFALSIKKYERINIRYGRIKVPILYRLGYIENMWLGKYDSQEGLLGDIYDFNLHNKVEYRNYIDSLYRLFSEGFRCVQYVNGDNQMRNRKRIYDYDDKQ